MLTITLVAFEALAVSTVLPKVARDLGGIALYGWVFSAFMLSNLVGITIAGFQADHRGPAPVLGAGLLLFAVGLGVAGSAPAMLVLVGARAVQGVGAGAMSAAVYVAVARGFTEDIRPRMFAIMSTAWVVPGLIGPAVAGALADALSWRAVFLGLLPLVVIGGALTLPALRSMGGAVVDGSSAGAYDDGGGVARRAADGGGVARRAAPVADALRLAAGTAVVLSGLTTNSTVLAPFLVVGGALAAVPALRRLLPPGTLRAAVGLPSAVATRALLNFGFFGADAYVPLAIASGGRSATAGGLALTAATLTWTAGAWIQERNSQRWSRRSVVTAGLVIVIIGVAAEAVALHDALPLAVPIAAWAVAGLGMGLAYQSLSLEVLANALPGREGEATAAMQLADVLGVALGAGFGGAVIAFSHHHHGDPRTGITVAFLVAVAGGIVGLAAAHRLPSSKPSATRPGAGPGG